MKFSMNLAYRGIKRAKIAYAMDILGKQKIVKKKGLIFFFFFNFALKTFYDFVGAERLNL
jgi:hypothetical protein